MRIILQLPEVKRNNFIRPKSCPHCEGETFQRWGQVEKQIKDTKVRRVHLYRYRCTSCRKTFRHYPTGITRAQQSERLQKLAVICWSLGLSYRGIEVILSAFGVMLSRMSGWRDVQAAGEGLRRRLRWKRARVVGVDGAWLNRHGVMVAVDLGDGELLSVAEIDEHDLPAVRGWLKVLKQQHQIGAIVTDDLGMYRGLTDQLELGHQVCQFHVRRWVGRSLRELEDKLPAEWLWILEEIKTIMEELPPDGSRRLFEMWKELPKSNRRSGERLPTETLRLLLSRLQTSWERYTAFFHDGEIPWTNNQTERMIGKFKTRAKSVRGYKTNTGRQNGILISSQTWT